MVPRFPALRATLVLALSGFGVVGASARCAKTQCTINSDCGFRRYCDFDGVCRAECAEDRDCENGYCDLNGRCRAGARDGGDGADAADGGDPGGPDVVTPIDNPPPPIDNPAPVDVVVSVDRPAPVDVPAPRDLVTPVDTPPPVDLGPGPGAGAYLDPCTAPSDCASLDCAAEPLGGGYCTRRCTSRRDCGDGYLCSFPASASAGRCLRDDTGLPCDINAPRTTCNVACYSTRGSLVAHCTRDCASGSDCPAGFACQPTGAVPPSVCVEVEVPCTGATQCATSVCLGGLGSFRGCSSQCRTAADCPPRAALDDGTGRPIALEPYTCETVGGVNICVPPLAVLGGDIAGSDRLGTSCDATAGAINTCRSGLCEATGAGSAGLCLQGCTLAGGCPPGFGCKPEADTPTSLISLVCRPAGNGSLGSACTRGSDCATALCLPPASGGPTGYCTRLCADGICPTGMTCQRQGYAADGSTVSLCAR